MAAAGWNPEDPAAWARALGLVSVPLFGSVQKAPPGTLSVLLDGDRGSLAFCASEDPSELIGGDDPLSWSWSANLPHVLIPNRKTGKVVHRQWAARGVLRPYSMPRGPADAATIFRQIKESARSARAGVIHRVLGVFRRVRAELGVYTSDPLIAMRAFNALLRGAERVRGGDASEADFRGATTLGDVYRLLDGPDEEWQTATAAVRAGSFTDAFLDDDPVTGCRLDPHLLVRHAAGDLYQEAHFELERTVQPSLPGLIGDPDYSGSGPRDARFTPPALARVLAQQAIDARHEVGPLPDVLTILDPACGSGVFLQEAVRELLARRYSGRVRLVGYDTSAVSCEVARFCLERARTDGSEGFTVEADVLHRDALTDEWPTADLILTNPPFVSWNRMSATERTAVRSLLGDRFEYKPDKAMAFVWKAVRSLAPGGALASVLPAPLLASEGGRKWREGVAAAGLRLIGRFDGFGYFQNALVEPAFVVTGGPHASRRPVTVVRAAEGREDEAIRLLRRRSAGGTEAGPDGCDVYEVPAIGPRAGGWTPRPRAVADLLSRLGSGPGRPAEERFRITQGVLTGSNSVFLLTAAEWKALPPEERPHFRPSAGTETIVDGRLKPAEYVFYPYQDNQPAFLTEAALEFALPTYYANILRPQRDRLAARQQQSETNWWQLARPRLSSDLLRPKIVSAYFGGPGKFAADLAGDTLPVHGYAWVWRPPAVTPSEDEEAEPVDEEDILLAYLALLNSSVFEQLLGQYCPRLQGGQYNLSRRFVRSVPLPELTDDDLYDAGVTDELVQLGRAIHDGSGWQPNDLTPLALRAYRVPAADWQAAFGG